MKRITIVRTTPPGTLMLLLLQRQITVAVAVAVAEITMITTITSAAEAISGMLLLVSL